MKKNVVFGVLALVFAAGQASAAVCSVGDTAKVEWKGKWYPARVLKVNDDQTRCYIKYDGYGSNWNEWVGPERIQVAGGKTAGMAFQAGDAVEVKWKGTWYKASVLTVQGGRAKIHYDGYDSSWDEWVGPDRIRPR